MTKTFKNIEIYNLVNLYQSLLENFDNLFLPIKANFYFKQNIKTLVCKGLEIDNFRSEIIKKYAKLKNDKYKFEEDNLEKANKEIEELMSLEQELDIKLIPLSAFDNVQITPKMMEIFIPMISEEE